MLLRKILEQAGGACEDGFVLVLDGEGLEDLPESLTTARGTYTVHRPTTELGLRHVLWAGSGAPLLLVVPRELAERLPADIRRRAQRETVHSLAVNEVLGTVLGVRVTGAEEGHLRELALSHIDALQNALHRRTLPTVVDRKLLTDLLVDVSLGPQLEGRSPGQLLASWVAKPPSWSAELRWLVAEALPARMGDEGRLLAWALEESERPRELVVHGALLTVDEKDLSQNAWGPLWEITRDTILGLDHARVRATACALAAEALEALGEGAQGVLDQADSLARRCLTPAQHQSSLLLPLAFEGRSMKLARRAASGEVVSADEIAWLERHRVSAMHRTEIAVLEAMARLSRYRARSEEPEGGVLDMVRRYQRHGAFADLAAAQLRRALAGTARHHAEAGAVLEAWRERRDEENRAFALRLKAGYEAALHTKGLIPLHRVGKRLLAERWASSPDDPIYLVVLDGCSYPAFLDLIYELAQNPVDPIGLLTDEAGELDAPPALSPLPTLTSHARGALFLGELPQDPLVPETAYRGEAEPKTDKARFNQNGSLGERSRTLFLKGDLHDGGQALLEALANTAYPVVAAVFNAVDDHIGSSNTGAMVQVRADQVTALVPSLKAALDAGRKVLVTADHGHTPFVDTSLRASAGPTSRYVELDTGGKAPEGFMEIDLQSLGGPPARRAFAWRVGVYRGQPQVGFHGGCGLEEMVVPMAWVGRGGVPAPEPSWWRGSLSVAPERRVSTVPPAAALPEVPTPVPVPTVAPTEIAQPATPAQADLFVLADHAARSGLPDSVLSVLTEEQRTVLAVLAQNGTARTSELAQLLETNPMRVNGLMAHLRRRLAPAGALCFEDETLPSGETLYRFNKPSGGKT